MIQRHLSISEVRAHSTHDVLDDDDSATTAVNSDDVAFLEGPMFQLGMSDNEAEDDHGFGVWSEDEFDRSVPNSSSRWKGVALPGSSKLARRRREMSHRPSVDSIDSGNLSGTSPPQVGFSPIV